MPSHCRAGDCCCQEAVGDPAVNARSGGRRGRRLRRREVSASVLQLDLVASRACRLRHGHPGPVLELGLHVIRVDRLREGDREGEGCCPRPCATRIASPIRSTSTALRTVPGRPAVRTPSTLRLRDLDRRPGDVRSEPRVRGKPSGGGHGGGASRRHRWPRTPLVVTDIDSYGRSRLSRRRRRGGRRERRAPSASAAGASRARPDHQRHGTRGEEHRRQRRLDPACDRRHRPHLARGKSRRRFGSPPPNVP